MGVPLLLKQPAPARGRKRIRRLAALSQAGNNLLPARGHSELTVESGQLTVIVLISALSPQNQHEKSPARGRKPLGLGVLVHRNS